LKSKFSPEKELIFFYKMIKTNLPHALANHFPGVFCAVHPVGLVLAVNPLIDCNDEVVHDAMRTKVARKGRYLNILNHGSESCNKSHALRRRSLEKKLLFLPVVEVDFGWCDEMVAGNTVAESQIAAIDDALKVLDHHVIHHDHRYDLNLDHFYLCVRQRVLNMPDFLLYYCD
jgi:hypothetical protein